MPAEQLPVDQVPAEKVTVPADPGPFVFDPAHIALVLIDMQRDFVEPGGFGETLGNDAGIRRGDLTDVLPGTVRVAQLLDSAAGHRADPALHRAADRRAGIRLGYLRRTRWPSSSQ
jgi:nicotinamidase-related amidase